jgi:hypothetical protein
VVTEEESKQQGQMATHILRRVTRWRYSAQSPANQPCTPDDTLTMRPCTPDSAAVSAMRPTSSFVSRKCPGCPVIVNSN